MNIITIGKRLIPAKQIAFVEPFDPASNPEFKPEREFKARLVLLNRDTVLLETSPQEFSEANGFPMLAEDNIAINPSIAFRVETFAPTENFKPEKGYRSRIKWRDPDGNEQSKLLIMEPEALVYELSNRGAKRTVDSTRSPERPARTRRRSRDSEPARNR